MRASRRVLAILLSCCDAAASWAADWDHDANVAAAVVDLVAAYRQDGMAGAELLVANCYEGIDGAGDKDNQLQRLETCAGIDFAAWRIDQAKAAAEGRAFAPFFSAELIMTRMERLSTLLQTPSVENQVLRAWSRAATDALERSGI